MDSWMFTLAVALITYVVIKAYQYRHYFEKWGIPQPSEIPFFGILGSGFFLNRHMSEGTKIAYNVNKEAKYVGLHIFFSRFILVRDPELIKSVLVKNFDYFAYHKDFIDEDVDPLFGKNLVFLNGERWKTVRNMLSPAFTSSKMKVMFVLMSKCAENFANQFVEIYGSKPAIDMKDLFTRYTNDVIATCAFGLEVDSVKHPNNDFYIRGRSASKTNGSVLFKFMLLRIFPDVCRKMKMRIISKRDTDFFVNTIKNTIETREKQGITRPDMLQLMMDSGVKSQKLDILEMAAQAFIFFLAGLETTSTQMCLMAHELATRPEIQEKLLAEVDDVMEKTNGNPTYEAVNNMVYLDAIFSEVLRAHSLPFLSRMCSKEFELPPALPGAKPYVMKPGSEIIIPACAIHSDPAYNQDPDKFDPDRFLDKKVTTMDSTTLGFGLGPRGCIGNRFAILETKVLFVHLLSKSSFVPCEKTCIPLEYEIGNFMPTAKGGFWLKIRPRN